MSNTRIDINSDLGESPESLANGTDFELMHYITSANIACGGHAGDEQTMRQTVAMARQLNVAVGAHPSYPDRANFGRVESFLSPLEIEETVREQISSLATIAREAGVPLVHVKPHGALYHAASRNAEIARAIARAAVAIDPALILVGQAGSPSLDIWRGTKLRCAAEAFADRAYERDGSLRKRTLPGALMATPKDAAEQALSIAVQQRVSTVEGVELRVAADTICIHSDTPGAVEIAREVNRRLKEAGVHVRALS